MIGRDDPCSIRLALSSASARRPPDRFQPLETLSLFSAMEDGMRYLLLPSQAQSTVELNVPETASGGFGFPNTGYEPMTAKTISGAGTVISLFRRRVPGIDVRNALPLLRGRPGQRPTAALLRKKLPEFRGNPMDSRTLLGKH